MPNELSPIALAILARATMKNNPENIRDLYTKIAQRDSLCNRYVLLFSDFLYDVFPMDAVRSALTEEEIRNLRSCVFTVFLQELRGFIQPGDPPIPALRQLMEEFYHAIQLLGPVTEQDSFEDQAVYAYLCARLDRYREARDISQRLLARKPDNAFVKALLAYASGRMSFPQFRFSFVSRCSHAWSVFALALQDYQKGHVNGDMLSGDTKNTFAIWTGLSVFLDCLSPEKGGTLHFSVKDWQLSLFPSQAAIAVGLAELPPKVSAVWHADFSTSGSSIRIVLEDGSSKSLGEALTVVKDTPKHEGVHLQVFHPILAYGTTPSDIMEACEKEVASVLGTPDYCMLIRSIQVLKRRPSNDTGTIDNLKEQLKALGYTLGHDLSEVETGRMFRKYTRKPQEGPMQRLRDDIRRGETVLWQLQDDYDRNETAAADYFMNLGIAPVFLAWPNSLPDGQEEALYAVLLNPAVALSLKPLGKAYGTQYNYMDLLVFNIPVVVQALEKFLSGLPGGDAVRIQSFYCDAVPSPVSLSQRKAQSSIPNLDKFFHPDSSRTPPQKSKEKKKNPAKAKRKHSKRFR